MIFSQMQYYVEPSYIDTCWEKCKFVIIALNFPKKWRFNQPELSPSYFSYELNVGIICIFPDEELIMHDVSKMQGNLYMEFSSFNKENFKQQIIENHPELEWPEKEKIIFPSQ